MFNLAKDNFVILETNRFDRDNRYSFLFSRPVRIITCYKMEEIRGAFSELEDFVSKGYYAAGFISYEAGFSFEDTLKGRSNDFSFPLLWFGVYKRPAVFGPGEKIVFWRRSVSPYTLKGLRPNITREEYISNIKRIKDFIRKGDTYQVNYTFKYKFRFSGSPYALYEDLKEKQNVSYSAFIKTSGFTILSMSPELFFRKTGNCIQVSPMKGTIDRGKDLTGDRHNIKNLRESPKDRSENVMIVDLLRNDIGRISSSGTVKAVRLFEVEKYETLFQMISRIRGILKKDISIYDLLKAIFPSGSVTGAPKISTMKIINSLEKEPRLIYTGGIGYFSPSGDAVFNVAIRTVLIDNEGNKGEMGVGSGIVYDSEPSKEFDECRLKADFITQKRLEFKLIETILWQSRKGYSLLKKHLLRLSSSAEYFNFKYERGCIVNELARLERHFKGEGSFKVRLLLNKDGRIETIFSRIDKESGPFKVSFSDKRVCSSDVFLYHKTTNRVLYNSEYAKWRKKGYSDIIFTNEKGHVTEGAISNIIIKKGKCYYTPPVECGLLNGVFRRHLIETRKIPVREKVLRREDILDADEVFMMNSVRGMVKVALGEKT